ncbi:MAG: aldo/keto reductase, partial [Candidatus Bathyarchaeia archaeon]
EKFMQTQPARNDLVRRAIELGVNYFDATQPEETRSLGLALKEAGAGSSVHVATMIITPFTKMASKPQSEWRQVIRDEVDKNLQLLQRPYSDILNLHMPEVDYSRERLRTALDVLQEYRSEGRIGFVGASSHQLKFLAELMRKYDCFDCVMVRYNYHLQEAGETIFPLAKALDVGVVVMKPLSWPYYGIPFIRFGPVEGESAELKPLDINLRWILNCPEVATVVPAMNHQCELEENSAAIMKDVAVKEEILDRYLKTALGPKGREKLKEMLNDKYIDIRYFAERALEE